MQVNEMTADKDLTKEQMIELLSQLRSEFFYFLDFEASSLHPESYPIEVGVYGGPEDSYESLIVPVHYWTHWNADSQDIHKIERETLFEQGRTVEEVTRSLNERFAGKILWADADTDGFWMQVLYEASPYDPTFKVGNIYHFLPEQLWKSFKANLPGVIAHRALQDAIDIKAAWVKLLDARLAELK